MGNTNMLGLGPEFAKARDALQFIYWELNCFDWRNAMQNNASSFGEYLDALAEAYSLGIVSKDEWTKRAKEILKLANSDVGASGLGLEIGSYMAIIGAFGYQINPWPAINQLWGFLPDGAKIGLLPSDLESLLSGKIKHTKHLRHKIGRLSDDDFRAALRCLSLNSQIGECDVKFVRFLMRHICQSRMQMFGARKLITVMLQNFAPVPIIDDSEDKLTLEW